MSGPEGRPTLRRMGLEDLPAAMELDTLSLSKPWSEAVWRDELESPFGLYLALEERAGAGRSISGQIGVRYVVDELHVTTIAVRPGRRRRGYARALLDAALGAFADARAVHLEVRPSNEPALALYDASGFVITGRRRRYYGDEDALLMTLALDGRHRQAAGDAAPRADGAAPLEARTVSEAAARGRDRPETRRTDPPR